MTVNFTPELKTGIERVDHEHQVLIATLKAASFFLIDNFDITQINTTINLFSRMAKAHFHNEEEILEKTDHPDKEMHKKEHQKLAKELDEICLNCGQERLADAVNKLEIWLMPHILVL